MGKLLLSKIINAENGKPVIFSAEQVFVKKDKKALDVLLDEIQTRIANLSGAEVEQLKTDLAQLKTTFQTFMTGEDDDNGALDRLKELVAAIEANKGSIDALVADKATKAELEALIARVASLEGKNWDLLGGLGKNETTGNLTFNGKELTGETGIAIGTSVETATQYNGKIQIILEEIEIPDAEPAA